MKTNSETTSSMRVSVIEDEQEQGDEEVSFSLAEDEQAGLGAGLGVGVGLVHHGHSSLDVLHHTKNTRRRRFSAHLPSSLLTQILSHLSNSDLAHTLRVSRLFFHLAGPILYRSLDLSSDKFDGVFKGAASYYEAESGRIAVGRKRFKDRLLRYTTVVNLFSHGDDDDDDDGNTTDGNGNEDDKDKDTLLDGSNDEDSGDTSTKASHHHNECPFVSLSTLFPHINKLQITLGDSYDYHTTFCSRAQNPFNKSPTSTCPLLDQLSMDIQKFTIYGARSPLVVLPLAFPIPKVPKPTVSSDNGIADGGIPSPRMNECSLISSPSSSSTTSLGNRRSLTPTPTLSLGSLPTFGLVSPAPSSSSRPSTPELVTPPLTPRPTYFRSLSSDQLLTTPNHSRTSSTPSTSFLPAPTTHVRVHRHAQTPLPLGLTELTIIIPSGKSYDSRDYSDSLHPHIFQVGEPSLSSLELLVIVFEPSLVSTLEKRDKWQIAYYDSHLNPDWTSYFSLVEDLTIALAAVPLYTRIKLVGMEKIDGELLNVGIGVREERVGLVIQERIKRRLEVRLRAEGREGEVAQRIERCEFVDYDQYTKQSDIRRY